MSAQYCNTCGGVLFGTTSDVTARPCFCVKPLQSIAGLDQRILERNINLEQRAEKAEAENAELKKQLTASLAEMMRYDANLDKMQELEARVAELEKIIIEAAHGEHAADAMLATLIKSKCIPACG